MNYLIVNRWENDNIVTPTPKEILALFRTVNARGAKGMKLAEAYERELNGGLRFLEASAAGASEGYSVCYEAYNQCREWRNFETWEDNPEYKLRGD